MWNNLYVNRKSFGCMPEFSPVEMFFLKQESGGSQRETLSSAIDDRGWIFYSLGVQCPEACLDREPVERLRLERGEDHGEVAVASERDSWSAGDLAREGFDQMPWGLAPGIFT